MLFLIIVVFNVATWPRLLPLNTPIMAALAAKYHLKGILLYLNLGNSTNVDDRYMLNKRLCEMLICTLSYLKLLFVVDRNVWHDPEEDFNEYYRQ